MRAWDSVVVPSLARFGHAPAPRGRVPVPAAAGPTLRGRAFCPGAWGSLAGRRSWAGVVVRSRARLGPAPARGSRDAATGQRVTTKPAGPARLYVCGITPYD